MYQEHSFGFISTLEILSCHYMFKGLNIFSKRSTPRTLCNRIECAAEIYIHQYRNVEEKRTELVECG